MPCLETNIYPVPPRKASQVKSSEKNTDIIEYLLKVIRPCGVLVHTKESLEYFQGLMDSSEFCGERPALMKIYGQPTCVWGLPGPLWRRKVADMEKIGAMMKDCIGFWL